MLQLLMSPKVVKPGARGSRESKGEAECKRGGEVIFPLAAAGAVGAELNTGEEATLGELIRGAIGLTAVGITFSKGKLESSRNLSELGSRSDQSFVDRGHASIFGIVSNFDFLSK